ncbi:MAG: RHS repeat protein, partial [Acidobacteria bacterium]|nr:RHS repeat protein [Acidobacteriota bacterium]
MSFDDPDLPVVTTVTDPLGEVSTYTFGRDNGSRKARLEELSGSCPACSVGPNTTLSYDDSNHPLRPTRETDARGIHTDTTYDAHGQVLTRTEASGTALERTTTWTYDTTYPALVTEIEQPSVAGGASMRTTTMTYNGMGALTGRQITGTEAPSGAFVFTTSYVPTSEGQTASIDPPGYGTADQTTFVYDPTRGGLVLTQRTDPVIGSTIFNNDAFNRRIEVTDHNGITTTTDFDVADHVTFVTQTGTTPAEDLVTENRYDELGRLAMTILPRGNAIEYTYDPAGRLLSVERKPDDQPTSHGERTVYELDAFGNRTREEQQVWDGAAWQTRMTTEYDWLNRCQMHAVIHETIPGTPPVQILTEYDYDCEGNLTSVWDANHPSAGQTEIPGTFYVYDELNRLTEVEQRWGGGGGGLSTTTYGYDVQDHLTSVTDAEGSPTTYTYSDRDLLTQEASLVSGTTTHQYNEHGELTQTTDARGVTVARTIDALDRVILADYPDDSLDVTYTYDDPSVAFSTGRLTAITRDGNSVDYAYDRFGRVTQDGALGYQYDQNSNRTEVEYPQGVTAVSTFDYADRPTSLTVQRPGEPDLPIATGATYEPAGPLNHLDLGNGLAETRPYSNRYFPGAISVAPTTP